LKGFYRGRQTGAKPDTNETHRINDRITAREVRLISAEGEQLGVFSTREALRMAEDAGLDLVEVSERPPVCRLMDYGKLKYKEQKKAAEARKKRAEIVIKELRLRYRTDVGDFETKMRQARDFLMGGDKVKFSMRFKGREAMYIDLGVEKFNEVAERLKDIAIVDDRSPAFGRQIHIIFAPLKGKTSEPIKNEASKKNEVTSTEKKQSTKE